LVEVASHSGCKGADGESAECVEVANSGLRSSAVFCELCVVSRALLRVCCLGQSVLGSGTSMLLDCGVVILDELDQSFNDVASSG